MGFWNNVSRLNLQDFRPGIRSVAEFGDRLVMACMEIGPGKEDAGHQHPFEQCGVVVAGRVEMFIGDRTARSGGDGNLFHPRRRDSRMENL